MKKLILICCCLIISHLAIYHITRIHTKNETLTDFKTNSLDALFVIQDPRFKDSSGTFEKETFQKMEQYGWEIQETEKDYLLQFLGQHELRISKEDTTTIRLLKSNKQ